MPRTVKLVEEGFSTFSSKPHRAIGLVVNAIALLVLISLEITTIFMGTNPALAAPIFTSSDQDQAMSSFISAFYDPNQSLLLHRYPKSRRSGLVDRSR